MVPESQVEEILEFVRTTEFTGYQRLVLPNGHVVPGQDRRPMADAIFPPRLDGKTVLDIGCYYGYFLHDAVERGAARAVGIEHEPERAAVANRLAPLWGGKVEIRQEKIETAQFNERFDYVLLLRVLHHLSDPVGVLRRLAALCRGTLIVEFRDPYDPQFLLHAKTGRLMPASGLDKIASRLRSRFYRWLTDDLPLMGIGSVPYERTFFPNRKAFRNLFVVQNAIFKELTFRPSPEKGGVIAFCECAP